jgi:hypothetical protein
LDVLPVWARNAQAKDSIRQTQIECERQRITAGSQTHESSYPTFETYALFAREHRTPALAGASGKRAGIYLTATEPFASSFCCRSDRKLYGGLRVQNRARRDLQSRKNVRAGAKGSQINETWI